MFRGSRFLLKPLTTKYTKKNTNNHEKARFDPRHLRLSAANLIVTRNPRVTDSVLWCKASWNDVVFIQFVIQTASIQPQTISIPLANRHKVEKICKIGETPRNMLITPLEMVTFTFRFRAERDRNASGTRNGIGQTGTSRPCATPLVHWYREQWSVVSGQWPAERRKLAAAVGSKTEDERR